ncbi:MAG: alanine racemase [Anaerovoracaceae bacterium]|jgi:alanine racemase
MRNAITSRSAWAEINLGNLRYNIRNIQKLVGSDRSIMGIIKAKAYGHGSIAVAGVLRRMGIEEFGVATLDEGIKLREAGFDEPITILSICPATAAYQIMDNDLSPLISSLQEAKVWSAMSAHYDATIRTFIAIDTGMGRIGYAPDSEETIREIRQIREMPGLEIRGLFTHFANADDADKTFMHQQLDEFNALRDRLKDEGIEFNEYCAANSAAIMDAPETWMDLVRPGIIMYGEYPSEDVNKDVLSIKPVMSVKAKIIRLRKVPPGFTVSYGRKFRAERESIIATIPIGYADGVPRCYSTEGKVLVNGRFAPIAGTICMDQCMIDVTDIPDVQEGDTVTLMGNDGDLSITAKDIADKSGTINYEILCGFGLRLAKIYLKGEGEKA